MNLRKTVMLPVQDPTALDRAKAILAAGGLVVFPTDTLYGLAANPVDAHALRDVYSAKERPTEKALPLLVGALDQLDQVVSVLPKGAQRLMSRFWPGALTLILPKRAELPPELTPYPGVAVRMPNEPFALELLRATGPLAVTSANRSDAANPQTALEVFEQLAGRIDLLIDGGRLNIGQASTIVDCSQADLKLIRQGPIAFEALLDVWSR